MVIVAQLVRALDCGSRGRRFEPGLSPSQRPNSQNFDCWVFIFLPISI